MARNVAGAKKKNVTWKCDVFTNTVLHEYIHYELEFDLNNPHVLTEEEVWKLMVLDIFEDVEEETLVLK
jgi:hypothetical protein